MVSFVLQILLDSGPVCVVIGHLKKKKISNQCGMQIFGELQLIANI